LSEGEVSETVAINVDDCVASPVKRKKKHPRTAHNTNGVPE